MRSRHSTVTFRHPFTLNRDVGELSAGSYDIEIDEEEIEATDRSAFRQVSIYFFVRNPASTRMIVVTPADLEFAMERDVDVAADPTGPTAN